MPDMSIPPIPPVPKVPPVTAPQRPPKIDRGYYLKEYDPKTGKGFLRPEWAEKGQKIMERDQKKPPLQTRYMPNGHIGNLWPQKGVLDSMGSVWKSPTMRMAVLR